MIKRIGLMLAAVILMGIGSCESGKKSSSSSLSGGNVTVVVQYNLDDLDAGDGTAGLTRFSTSGECYTLQGIRRYQVVLGFDQDLLDFRSVDNLYFEPTPGTYVCDPVIATANTVTVDCATGLDVVQAGTFDIFRFRFFFAGRDPVIGDFQVLSTLNSLLLREDNAPCDTVIDNFPILPEVSLSRVSVKSVTIDAI